VQDLFEYLKLLSLPDGDYAVFGSGPLIVRGVIAPTNDLDVICRRLAWERVQEIGTLQFNDDYGVEIVTLFDGKVTFGNKWGIGDFNVDELIDDADHFDGLPFVKLKHVIEYKLIRKSKKDVQHIESFRQSKYFAPLHKID
jgi:hypothetical protein